MEIKNQPVQCPNGHYYNPQIHSSCPICAQEAAGGIPATDQVAGSFAKTESPYAGAGASAGSFGKTESPYAGGDMSGGQGSFVKTEPAMSGGVSPSADSASPFEPTIIGGDISSDESQTAPVVGWLVCIDGAMRGVDFRIHAGYNYIGREVGDIHITGDQQISRQNHAMVAYDETDMVYFAGPSAGRNLVKVNGKTVFNAVEIHNYDVISLGTTKLMFVGLCGEHFNWKR